MSIDYSSLRFLLIEDSQTFVVALEKMLKDLNVSEYDSTSKGEKALQMLKDQPVDVVLCDYNLRDSLNGQQILEQVSFQKLLKPTAAFIMVTGDPDVENLTTSAEARADDYIIKPVSFDLLKKHLDYVVDFKSRIAPALVALDNEDYPAVQKACDLVIKEKPQYVLPVLRIKAEAHIHENQFEQANKIYSKILEHKNIPWAQFGLAQSHYFLKDHNKAEKIFEQVIRDKENFTIAYDWLAKVQVALEDKPEALETLLKAVSIAPNSLIRQMEVADIAKDLKKYEISSRAYKRAISLGQNSRYKTPGIYLSLAQVLLAQAKEGDNVSEDDKNTILQITEEARQAFRREKLVQIEANLIDAKVYAIVGAMDDQKKAIQQAFDVYEDAKLKPITQAKAALLYFDYGEVKYGQDVAKEVAEECAYAGEPMTIIGRILKHTPQSQDAAKAFEAGDYEGACKHYQAALKVCPDSTDINLNAIHAMLVYAEHNGKIDDLSTSIRKSFKNIERRHLSSAQTSKYDELENKFKALQD